MDVKSISAKEARRLEKIEKSLIEKIKRAEEVDREARGKRTAVSEPSPSDHAEEETSKAGQPLTVDSAKRLEKMKDKLQAEFANAQRGEIDSLRENEKMFEPVTRALKEQIDLAKERKEMRKQTRQLIPFRPRINSTPTVDRKQESVSETDDDKDANRSMRELVESKKVNVGLRGTRYLPRAKDAKFGIWYDDDTETMKIGSEPITFDYDDIVFVDTGRKYTGTEGLWKLLTSSGPLRQEIDFTVDDWNSYKSILLTTNSLYQKNDPSTGRPKSSAGLKWKVMIKKIWDESIKGNTGSGLKKYNEQPMEYKYISNLSELINRLLYIKAQEEAGNNNFHNEKLSVVRFISDRMEELVTTPKGIQYIVRCLSALPHHMIEGSGLLNTIINKLPFELHAPRNWKFDTYEFCGPGTRLDERLARGDKGINKLDAACKEHDIWYRDHKDAEDRWASDKVLQRKAWERVVSDDADFNERAVALATTGGMWLKRKLGMGLSTSGCIYPE